MTLAVLGIGDDVAPLATLAAVMIATQLVLLYLFLPRRHDPSRPRLSRAILIGYLLPSTALMWVVLPGAVLAPSYATWWAAIQAMMVPMPAPFLWMMSQLARAEERPVDRAGPWWPVLLAVAVVANEALMGYAFAALAGAPSLDDATSWFALSVNSPWFAISMLVTMAALLWWIPGPPALRAALGGLAASGLAGPLWLVDPLWSAVAMAVVMTGTLLVLVVAAIGRWAGSSDLGRLPLGIGAGLAAMTAGGAASAYVPGLGPYGVPLAVATLGIMGAETAYLLHRGLASIPDPSPPFSSRLETPAPA